MSWHATHSSGLSSCTRPTGRQGGPEHTWHTAALRRTRSNADSTHVELLRDRRFNDMAIEHLLAELSDMDKSERRELESRLLLMTARLLKWEYQCPALSEQWREFDGSSWPPSGVNVAGVPGRDRSTKRSSRGHHALALPTYPPTLDGGPPEAQLLGALAARPCRQRRAE